MSPVLFNLLVLAAGLLLLLAGGRALVDGAINLAARLSVPPLLIGLTVVAWGTSAPELAFNTIASVQGKTDLVFGNVMGASICNLGLILGAAALIRPLAVHTEIILREIPFMGALMLVALAMAVVPPAAMGFSRAEGAGLLVLFGIYSVFVIILGIRARLTELAREVQEEEAEVIRRPLWLAIVLMVLGLAGLGAGGALAAEGATGLARGLGISQQIIGLTIVALGTTLPELTTALIALSRGHVDLAIGNVVGSCIFNLGCIYGVGVMIAPAPLPEAGLVPLGVMCALGLLLLPLVRDRAIVRWEGALMLLIYIAFLAFQALAALRGVGAAGGPGAALP